MSIPYRPDFPDEQTIRLTLTDSKVGIDRWTSYEFSSDFLNPTDHFHFSLGLDEDGLPEAQKSALRFGARLRCYIDKNVLADGRIDALEIAVDRHGGNTVSVRGRDRFGQSLDVVADPTFQFKEGGTLADFLKQIFGPLGWSGDHHFDIDNAANRAAKSGLRGTPMTKGGKKKGPRPLKSYVLHQTKPYNHESIFHFASRVAQRHGLWIWPSADGEKLIVGKPDFDQTPIFKLRRARDGGGNVLSGSVNFDMTDQPTILIADAFGGGGEFGKGRYKSYIVNPLLGFDDNGEYIPEIKKVLEKYPGASKNVMPSQSFLLRADSLPFRPMFLHDAESKTSEQLDAFVKREMSLLVRKGVTAHYEVEGHGQSVNGDFVTWTPDTVVHVEDEAADLDERLYVLGCHFSKSRSGGTKTRLDLIRLHSIEF
jgi:prophage tail gpP-like protein